jgi:membrane protein implicated in regulation of membrane protease activity
VLSVFVVAFGGTGAIATNLGASVLASSLAGAMSGVVFSGLIFAFATFLHSQQASSDIRREQLIGKIAEVTVGIPQGGLGQIRCRIGDTFVDRIARASDGGAIPVHKVVRIEADAGETVLVGALVEVPKE